MPRWELAAVAAAALLIPAWLLKLASIVALRRRARSPLGSDLVAIIAAHPGIRHVELVRRIGRGNGTVEHHLSALMRNGTVQRVPRGSATFYYLRAHRLTAEDHQRMIMRGATARRVIEELRIAPGLNLVELASRLDVAASTAHHHILRLTAAGLVRDARKGNSRCLFVA